MNRWTCGQRLAHWGLRSNRRTCITSDEHWKIDTVQAPHHGSRTSLSDPPRKHNRGGRFMWTNNAVSSQKITDRVKTRGLKLVSTHTKGSIGWLDRVRTKLSSAIG